MNIDITPQRSSDEGRMVGDGPGKALPCVERCVTTLGRSSRQREVGGGLGAYSEPREVRVMWARQAQGRDAGRSSRLGPAKANWGM